MILGLLVACAIYLLTGIGVYAYAVIKSYEILGFWSFKIHDGYIGICKYPKWLMGWMRWIARKFQ